jgi:hypothetical protein
MATRIQSHIRKLLARIYYLKIKLIRKGKVILASKVIMRAWTNFIFHKRFQLLLDIHRLVIFIYLYIYMHV